MDLLRQLAESRARVDFAQGLDCRLLTDENIEAIKAIKLKEIHFAWDFMSARDAVLNGLRKYAKQGKKNQHGKIGSVYVLTNFNTTMEENLYRIYTLRDMGYDPYVMIYDKPHAPQEIKDLQRWCNNRIIFKKVKDFYNYKKNLGG